MTPSSLRTGIAFAVTVGAGYAACTLVFWLWPGASLAFTNALFHGLDFGRLQGTKPFDFGGFLYALIGLVVWAFVLGTVFDWISRKLAAVKSAT